MKNLIQETIEKIKDQHIAPEPRWKFLVRKYGLWLVFSILIFLGAVSLSVAYYLISGLDWDLYGFRQQRRLGYALSIFPYFWLALIAIFLALAFWEIRRTETGYRYNWNKIALLILGGIVIPGIIFSVLNFGKRLNPVMEKNIPYYNHMLVTKESQWMQPGKGFLAGDIIAASKNELSIRDLDGKKWDILISDDTLVKPSVDLTPGETIKIIGTQQDENNFKAQEIRPWAGKGMMKGKGQGGAVKGMMRGR